jgi:hypothetical protein
LIFQVLNLAAEDIRLLAFSGRESVENLICALPVTYSEFDSHDRYAGSTRYEMDTLFRVFVLKECHGWDHETALIEYLEFRMVLCE